MATRPTTFSMRMPQDLNEKIQAYATEHNCTKAEAMSHFARAGIELEENGPAPAADGSQAALENIQRRLEALQNLPTIEPASQEAVTAIVPADIREKIQEYSTEHECSEQDALTYYARIGVQMTAEQRPANVADLATLTAKIDALAQDSAAKTEQLKQMSEMLLAVHDFTKPDELELEGELADSAEDVEEAELTEEERQRIADEHTRQVVSDVMEDLLSRQQKEQIAREEEAEARREAAQTNTMNPWLPMLVAVIISLIIGLVVILIR